MRYMPLAGTHAWRDAWTRADSDFGRLMAGEGFAIILAGGRPYRWSTALDGLIGADRNWEAAADSAFYFLRDVPFEDLNLIGHSDGGNVALILAASGFRIRTLTTIGTPPREEINLVDAEAHIEFHQHIYDLRRDLWGWLGQVGPGQLHFDRKFNHPRVLNIALEGIGHSSILRDAAQLHFWRDAGAIANIRAGRKAAA